MSENGKKFDVNTDGIDKKGLTPGDTGRKLIGVISALAFIVAALFLVIELPDYFSQKNFDKAVAYEQSYDFENAIIYYEKIRKSDDKNYQTANEKISLLNGYLEKNKTVAQAIIAAKNTRLAEYTDFSQIEDIKMSVDGGNISFVFDGAGIIVSQYKPSESRYYTYSYDEVYGVYVSKYAPSSSYNGIISALTDRVKAEASSFMFKQETAEYSSLDIMPKIIEQYLK